MTTTTQTADPPRLHLFLALTSVYIIWGSTYIGIHFMTEHLPPLFMSSIRFLVAGSLMYGFVRLKRAAPAPTLSNWKAASLIGTLLLVVGNGGLAIALRTIPTGIAALLVATLPLWIAILNWVTFNKTRPSVQVMAGLLLGLAGMVILIGPDRLAAGQKGLDPFGVALIIMGSISWAIATLQSPRANLPKFQLLSTAIQMISAAVFSFIASFFLEDWSEIGIYFFTWKPMLALGYLITFGSIIGFTSYTWLVRNAPPSLVSTYAYVNPLVAMFLGAALAAETLSERSILAAVTIIAGVVLITAKRKTKS
jgi:drug/metabolite transporter (DMT)-like permease